MDSRLNVNGWHWHFGKERKINIISITFKPFVENMTYKNTIHDNYGLWQRSAASALGSFTVRIWDRHCTCLCVILFNSFLTEVLWPEWNDVRGESKKHKRTNEHLKENNRSQHCSVSATGVQCFPRTALYSRLTTVIHIDICIYIWVSECVCTGGKTKAGASLCSFKWLKSVLTWGVLPALVSSS